MWKKIKNWCKNHKYELAIAGACAAGGALALVATNAVKNSTDTTDTTDIPELTEIEHNPDLDITLTMRFFDEDGNEYLPDDHDPIRCSKVFADDLFDIC